MTNDCSPVKAGAQAAHSADRPPARHYFRAWTPAFAGEQGGD
jgi:hypothetical protein